MSERPTVYVSNWASRKSPGRWGPGRRWTIMANPNPLHGELGEGSVPVFVPTDHALPGARFMARTLMEAALRAKGTPEEEQALTRYREEFARQLQVFRELGHGYAPRSLVAHLPDGTAVYVADGDTLNCVCRADQAAIGRCHRAWTVPLLLDEGWRVVLDGRVVG